MEEFLHQVRTKNNADKFPLNTKFFSDSEKFYTLFIPINESFEAILEHLNISRREFLNFPALEALEKFHVGTRFESEANSLTYVTTLNGMKFEYGGDPVMIDGLEIVGGPYNFMTDEEDEFSGGLDVYFIDGVLSTRNVTDQLSRWAERVHSKGDDDCIVL